MQHNEIPAFIALRLRDVASFNGCVGTRDGICIELSPDNPVEWCKYCVQGEASKIIDSALRADALAPHSQKVEHEDDPSRGDTSEISPRLQSSASTDGVLSAPAPNDMSGYDEALVCNGQCGGYLDTPSKFRLFCTLARGHAGQHMCNPPGAKVSWDATPDPKWDGIVGQTRLLIARFRSLGGIPDLCDLAWQLCNENERLRADALAPPSAEKTHETQRRQAETHQGADHQAGGNSELELIDALAPPEPGK